jgi:hypothetical protein
MLLKLHLFLKIIFGLMQVENGCLFCPKQQPRLVLFVSVIVRVTTLH